MAWIRQEQLSSLWLILPRVSHFPWSLCRFCESLGHHHLDLKIEVKEVLLHKKTKYQDLLVFAWTSVGFVHIWSCKNWGNRLSTSWWNPCQATEQIHLQGHCLNPSHAMPCFMSCLAEASTNHGNVIVLASSSASTFPWSVMACCAACTLQGRGHGLKSFFSGRGDPDHRERWCWSENWQDP